LILFVMWKVSGDSARVRISAPSEDVNELAKTSPAGEERRTEVKDEWSIHQ